MLKRHLYAYADAIDERQYVISFRDDRSTLANRAFAETEEDSVEGAESYWRWYYGARLSALGLAIPPSAAILDCACGIGRLGSAVHRRAAPRLVAFCDLSIEQLRNVPPLPHAFAQLGDICRLPYADDSFDVVLGNSFLHHLADVPAALAEIRRVCKPGGWFAVLHEPSVHAPFWEAFPVSLYKNVYRHPDQTNFTDLWCFAPRDLEAVMRKAGWSDVRISAGGLLGAAATNPYLHLVTKLRLRAAAWRIPVYRLRVLMDRFESAVTGGRGFPTAPSLVVAARKPEASP